MARGLLRFAPALRVAPATPVLLALRGSSLPPWFYTEPCGADPFSSFAACFW